MQKLQGFKKDDFNGMCKDWYFSINEDKTLVDNLREAAEVGIASFFLDDTEWLVDFSVFGVESNNIAGDISELKIKAVLCLNEESIVIGEDTLQDVILDFINAGFVGESHRMASKSTAKLLRNIVSILDDWSARGEE
jgi:hypothetical protein